MKILRLQGDIEKQQGIHYEYDVESPPLGEGGMGRVFQGFRIGERNQTRTRVAIKEVYHDVPTSIIERARREASIQLENDHLIRMFSFVETIVPDAERGINKISYYVVMELLIGVTLAEWLNGQVVNKQGIPIPYASQLYTMYVHHKEETVIKIIKCILSGIMALHDLGYIHRDIDPSNIMITHNGKIKLIDFGICKPINTLHTPDQYLTQYGSFMGKVHYASPELVTGDVYHQNETTDIYAIGILLYQLYTGQLPFSGTHYELQKAQLKQKIPTHLLSHPGIRKIILKATQKKQEQRYTSAAEFRVAVEHLSVVNSHFILNTEQWKKIGIYGGTSIFFVSTLWFILHSITAPTPPLPEAPSNAHPITEASLHSKIDSTEEKDKTGAIHKATPILLPTAPLSPALTRAEEKSHLEISEQLLNFPVGGGEKWITINTNISDWKISANIPWSKIQKGTNYLRITVNPNTSDKVRTSSLMIIAGQIKKTIQLHQEALVNEKKADSVVTTTEKSPLLNSDTKKQSMLPPASASSDEKDKSLSKATYIQLDENQVDKREYDIKSNGQSDYLIILRGSRKSKTRIAVGQAVELSFPLKNMSPKITICKTGIDGNKAKFNYSSTATSDIPYTKDIDKIRQICHLRFSLPTRGEYVIYIKGHKTYAFLGAD